MDSIGGRTRVIRSKLQLELVRKKVVHIETCRRPAIVRAVFDNPFLIHVAETKENSSAIVTSGNTQVVFQEITILKNLVKIGIIVERL